MSAASGTVQCRVCKERPATYTCPRCNARYCGVDCYKAHSQRCTEGFYRESTVQELRSIKATQDQQQRMQEILQRLHEAELADGGGSSSDEEGGGGASGGAGQAGGLSEATLRRLLARLQASGGKDIYVGEEDLSSAELAAFHRALAAGELSSAVAPWQPWWLGDEAAALQLGAGGTRLVAEGEEEGAGGGGGLDQPDSDGSGGGSGLPAPPSRPLPPLAALTRAAPSPLLQYQLLDLLYAYAFTLRLFNGEYGPVAAEAADVAMALSAVLAATAAGGGGGGGGGGDAAASSSAAAPSAASVLLGCVGRACTPPAGSREHRSFAVGVLADVAALLARGRALTLLALLDLSRMLEAAKQQAAGERCGAGASGSSKAVARRLVAAQRKLVFFLSWANELPEEAYTLLRAAVEAEQRQHAATLPAAAAARGQQQAQGVGGGVGGIVAGAAAAQAEAAVKPAARPAIEELQA